MKNPGALLLAASILMVGCSATNTVTMTVTEPAVVHLPADMTRMGVINRTLSEEDGGVLETIDQVFSARGPVLDSVGAEAGLNGFVDELSKSDRFPVIRELGLVGVENHAYRALPAPIPWREIDAICSAHDLDGLVALEFYRTKTDIDYSTEKVTLEGPLEVDIPVLEHHAAVETTIDAGWRIYDANVRSVVDEFVVRESVVTTGSGINPGEAAGALTSRTEAVKILSGRIGRGYALRLLPYRTRVTRDYYVRGSEAFELAKRRAQTGNWEGAAELWMAETEHPDGKVAGRAHYNMAIINEIRGNLDEAIEWARVAYEAYGDNRALRYLRVLQDRRTALALL